MKKILYPLIIVVIIATVIIAVYFLRQKPSAQFSIESSGKLPAAGNINNPPAGTPTAQPSAAGKNQPLSSANQKFGVIAENPVLNYFVDSQNNAVLIQPDGQIVKVISGAATVLSSSVITDLIKADFSFDGNKILVVFGDKFSPQFSVFDVAGKSWQPLSITANAAAWSPDTYQIAYFVAEKNGVKTLATLDISKPKAKAVSVIKIHAEDVFPIWLGRNQILVSGKESSFYPASLWSLNTTTKIITPFMTDTPGLETNWSGAAGMGLAFGTNNLHRGGSMNLLSASGNRLQGMSFLTLPSKCSFSVETQPAAASSTQATSTAKTNAISAKTKSAPLPEQKIFLYCAVPRDSETFGISQLPDDYLNRKFFTSDNFYKIDLQNGNVDAVFADPTFELDAHDPKIFNQNLLFINRLDKRLYAISLK